MPLGLLGEVDAARIVPAQFGSAQHLERVVEHLFRWSEWRILESSADYTKMDSSTIEFRANIAANGAAVTTYELNKLSYRGCQGCYACKSTHDHCIVQDDLTEVLEAVRGADGAWANPNYINVGGGSWGFQAGVQKSDLILVFTSPRGVDNIIKGKFTLGADAAVTAGPVGRNLQASTDEKLKAEGHKSRIMFGFATDETPELLPFGDHPRQFGPDTEVEIVWVGPYAYRSQCLEALRVGRVFFMGDTAKVVLRRDGVEITVTPTLTNPQRLNAWRGSNAVVPNDYLSWDIETKDNRMLTGLIMAQTDQTVTVGATVIALFPLAMHGGRRGLRRWLPAVALGVVILAGAILLMAFGTDRALEAGPPFGQSAGLVDDQRVDLAQVLDRRRVAEQDAAQRALAGGHHDRHRRGEAQRARAGDDQN